MNRDGPDWLRIFPEADHRWAMGLRPGTLEEFAASRDASGAVQAERAHWLADDPHKYAALLAEAEPALAETLALARSLGVVIAPAPSPWEQLLALGRAWEIDFVWMHPDEGGAIRMIGGVVCFPSSWALRDKLGKSMTDTHAPVPGLNELLARQIDTFLSRQSPGDVWTRENIGFSRDAEWNHHPSRSRLSLDSSVTRDEVFIRLEHQLLLKLPLSGSILFGIRVEIVPLRELMQDAQATSRLHRMLSTISSRAASYKGIDSARMRLLELLNHRE